MKICANGVLLAAAAGLLAGCGDKAEPEMQADDGRMAAGEILPGTISDAMLPYDTVRSKPPLARISDIPESEGGPPPVADTSADRDAATATATVTGTGTDQQSSDDPPPPAVSEPD